ncbi:MAG: AAA family ATPase [Acidobacteria bacterium]|nr:AAA family ATPase [Acidobacteriota bacterium]
MTLGIPEFVGRTSTLDSVVHRAARGGSVMLVGPVGIGRSRLLGEVATRLETAGTRVIRLTATASAASVPFGILLGLLDRPTIVRIGAEDALGRAAIVRAGVLALEPGAVLVDEASLLDPASAAFLLELARSDASVVATVTAGRRVPDAIRALVDEGLATTIRLGPLDTTGCAALAASVLGGPVESALAAALVEVAEGSPTGVQEVLRAALAAGSVQLTDRLWRLRGELPAPVAARRRAAAEFLAASPEVQEWLCAVAVADEIADDLAEHLCADRVADEVERAGWTSHDDRFRVTRMRRVAQSEAVLETAGARQRRSTLRRLLAATAEVPRPLSDRERIARGAWRLELGDDLPAEDALRLGALTSLSDPDLAERFLRHAVAVDGGTAADVALAEHLKRTDRLDEAQQLLGTAAFYGDERAAGEVAKALALAAGFGARRSGQALPMLDAHLLQHGEQPDLLAVRSGLLRSELRYREALPAAEQLRRGALGFAAVFAGINEALLRTELGEPWAALQVVHTELGEPRAALQVVEVLRRPALRAVDRLPEGPALLDWLSAWAPAVGSLDLRTAEAIAGRSYDRTVETGLHALRAPFAHLLGRTRALEGDVETAAHLLHEAVGLPGVWRDSWLPVILADLAVALTRSDDLAGAARAIARADGGPVPPAQHGPLRLAEAELLAARGDPDGAVALARDVAARAHDAGAVVEEWDARFAGVRFGDADAAQALAGLAPLPGEAREAQHDHARALVAGDLGALDGVARRYWSAGLRWFAIETVLRTVGLRTDQGLPTAATAERLAGWPAEVPAVRARHPEADASGALTSREREVVALAARGLPDRGVAEELGISVRTAQTHLSRAFTKLGVHRRSELVGLLDDVS